MSKSVHISLTTYPAAKALVRRAAQLTRTSTKPSLSMNEWAMRVLIPAAVERVQGSAAGGNKEDERLLKELKL